MPAIIERTIENYNVLEAIEWLKKQDKHDVEDSIEYLDSILKELTLLMLYKELFPVEYSKSKAEVFSYPNNSVQCYSPREEEFLGLVNQRLFHISDLNYEERQECIWVTPLNYDWWNDDYSSLPLIYQLSLSFTSANEFDWTYLLELNGLENDPILSKVEIAACKDINQDKLFSICRRTPGPLKWLGLAIHVVDHSTRNVWLDISYENGIEETCNWTLENIRILTREYRKATKKLSMIYSLEDYLKENLQKHLHQAVIIWNTSVF
jgi:hypothetical protein